MGADEDNAGAGLEPVDGAVDVAGALRVDPTEGVDVGVGKVVDVGVGAELWLVGCAEDVGVGEYGVGVAVGVDVALLPTGTFPQTTELDGFPAAILITVTATITVTRITAATAASVRQLGRRGPCGASALPSCPPSCPPPCWLDACVASLAVAGPPSHQARSCPGVGPVSAAAWSCAPAGCARRAPYMFARCMTTGAAVRSFSPVRDR